MTDKNIPSSSEPKDLHESPVPTEQPVSSKDKDKSKEKSSIVSSKNKTAKIALLALITAIAGCTGLFVWQQQQNQLLSQQIELNNTKLVQQYQKQTKQILTQQKNIFNQQLSEITSQINVLKDKNIDELSKSVQRLEKNIKQRQPSDWLLHETEYLIRIAARTLWLEHDTATAISLLKDADARLAELNNPSFLSIREIIHQDIKSLELMPILQTDEIILALMAMNKQIDILPLTMMNLGKEPHQRESLELSDDINDWQSNLAKTWQQFLDDFISISQKTG
nr:uroporphyrinogen-III C-methyltransferase [Colwellia sp.]